MEVNEVTAFEPTGGLGLIALVGTIHAGVVYVTTSIGGMRSRTAIIRSDGRSERMKRKYRLTVGGGLTGGQ